MSLGNGRVWHENTPVEEVVMATLTIKVNERTSTVTAANVTSIDWNSYPIMRFEEHAGVTPIVVQRKDAWSSAAGEELMAACGNT
jgi:hypothetical protein